LKRDSAFPASIETERQGIQISRLQYFITLVVYLKPHGLEALHLSFGVAVADSLIDPH